MLIQFIRSTISTLIQFFQIKITIKSMSALTEIKKAIEQAGDDKATIAQLNLQGIKIGSFSKEITKTLQQCLGLEILIVSDCDLESLEGLPNINIQGIDLSNNKITDKDLKHLKKYSRLTQILLTSNKIEKLDSLKVLQQCKNLDQLEISDNPITSDPNYRKSIFQMLDQVKCVDGKDVEGNQIQEQDEFEDDEDDEQDFDSEDDEEEDDQEQEQSQQQPQPSKKQKK